VDGALTLRITGAHLSLDARWSSAPGAPLTAAWPVADDGLLGPPLRSGAVLAASIHVAGTERLRALPRAEIFERGWVQLWREARRCGRPARALLLGFAWPELAGQWLADVAAVSGPAARLVGAVRNLGFAARRVAAGDRRGWRAALEGSIAPAGMRPIQAVLDAVFGGQRASRRPRRHLAWDGVYLHPYALSRGKRGGVIGVAIGEGARRWRLAQPLRARRVQPRMLARAAGNAAALLRQLVPGLSPPLRALAATAARRVGSFDGAVTVQADGVRASLTLRRR
jgi:hypothetical protein